MSLLVGWSREGTLDVEPYLWPMVALYILYDPAICGGQMYTAQVTSGTFHWFTLTVFAFVFFYDDVGWNKVIIKPKV